MNDRPDSALLLPDERTAIREHLTRSYAGVFTEDDVERALDDYVGFTFSDGMLRLVIEHTPAPIRLLDIGSGYGAFVLRARQSDIDATGVEIAPFEVEFARSRLRRMRPEDDPEQVYLSGDALCLDLPEQSFDVVTLWNVIEHIDDYASLFSRVHELLRPGGRAYIVCPNYTSFRPEAHYQVPWRPFLSRTAAIKRLRRFGKDPSFFETSIFTRTNWGTLRQLKRLDFELAELYCSIRMDLSLTNLATVLKHPVAALRFYNPFKYAVLAIGRRKQAN